MKSLIKSALIIATALTAQYGMAQRGGADRGNEKYVLQFDGDEHLQNGHLALKNKLKREHDVNIRDLKVKKIRLFAKSKNGGGKATLKMGGDESRSYSVPGNRRDFRNSARSTFHKVIMDALGDGSINRGVFRILLRGNIKVDRVVIIAEKQRNNRGNGWECTADGFNRRDNLQDVVGSCERNQNDAEDSALSKCERRLDDCQIKECEEKRCSGVIQPDPQPEPDPYPSWDPVFGQLQVVCNCNTGKRCYKKNGVVTKCVYDCSNGYRFPGNPVVFADAQCRVRR